MPVHPVASPPAHILSSASIEDALTFLSTGPIFLSRAHNFAPPPVQFYLAGSQRLRKGTQKTRAANIVSSTDGSGFSLHSLAENSSIRSGQTICRPTSSPCAARNLEGLTGVMRGSTTRSRIRPYLIESSVSIRFFDAALNPGVHWLMSVDLAHGWLVMP